MAETDRRIHPSPYPQWYATQDTSRGVWLCDKASDPGKSWSSRLPSGDGIGLGTSPRTARVSM